MVDKEYRSNNILDVYMSDFRTVATILIYFWRGGSSFKDQFFEGYFFMNKTPGTNKNIH